MYSGLPDWGMGVRTLLPLPAFSPLFGQCLLFMRFWGRRNLSVARHTGLRVPFMMKQCVREPWRAGESSFYGGCRLSTVHLAE